ncbi:HNH endonuclease signature motif containing protein [Arthrobacter oryzae]|uniref:HNH endonuclease signature motif containing protein n=1 Tax=Arthrobacter oryzae TaxID=409290 RepID=UPI00278024EB|nr:HNH endonuclease signature motif containing protein [Arthrobacter oryzae]MDQ0076570.1 hypothetical protein [Arthrobacter oryzae]
MGEDPAGGAGPWALLPPAAGPAVLPGARFRGLRRVPPVTEQEVGLGAAYRSEAASGGGGCGDLARCVELLRGLGSRAVADAALLDFRAAAAFAARVEEAARSLEFLQVVAAGAVDRTRREAAVAARSGPGSGSGAAAGWVTGWGDETAAVEGPVGWTARADGWITGPGPAVAAEVPEPTPAVVRAAVPGLTRDPADDGCRNAAEFLRDSLRIGIAEARRRLSLAGTVLPRTGISGHIEPPERPVLAAAVAAGTVASRSATIITLALEKVRHHAPEETVARMEHQLTRQAVESDADLLSRVARRWIEGIDQDGSEPSEEELRRRQGVFLRQARRGLQHIEIFATPDQCEPLLTVMNTATNPRTRMLDGTGAAPDDALDLRTRPQRLLDGLVGATKASLTTGALPAAGGFKPQVMVTIDYRDLLDRLGRLNPDTGTPGPGRTAPGPGPGPGRGNGAESSTGTGIPGTGSFAFTGPVNASTVRKIACDADIIPVLLGSEGRILDIGRTTRIFPPHIRKAITARDQGCAFPGCTIPAPWCEAHHITYWSHGGPTGTDNGTLLCSHHHHLIHKEQWHIQDKTGVPWFIPPPHIDPRQKPRRNNYFRLE